jgi:signal transduction histidine kinase
VASVSEESTLDVWERRLEVLPQAVPYVVLVVALVLTAIADNPADGRGSVAGTLALGVGAGLWMFWWVTLHPQWSGRPKLMGTYFAGLMVLFAVLQYRNPLFGIFSFAGYVHALALLRGRWAFVGIGVTGAISANALYGGRPPTTWAGVPTYVLLILAITVLALTFSLVGQVTSTQSSQRKRTVAALAEANAQLREAMEENAGLHALLLTQAREAGILDERQRMAREIHDTLAQGLAGIITQVQAAEQARDRPEDWQRHLDHAAALARESLSEARRSVHAVRPEPLETARLPEALAEVVRRWSTMNGVTAELVTTGTPRPLHPEVEIVLLRTGQEALANVAKHAGASRVALTLSYMEDVVTLDVRDDGAGFDLETMAVGGRPSGGFGLTSMRQRVSRLTGTLTVESEPGGGTAVSATVPAILPAGPG